MAAPEDWSFSVADFNGVARLFPLPDLVVFPRVMQSLHVFEPRYRELLEDALAQDQLICLATLAPGWEKDYEGRPPIHPVACLGRVVAHRPLENGRYNILFAGLKRVRPKRELAPLKSYREAEVEILADHYPAASAARRGELQRRLFDQFGKFLSPSPEAREQFELLRAGNIELGVLTDVIAHALRLDLELKIELLGETNVDRRAQALVERLRSLALGSLAGSSKSAEGESAGGAKFPPEFSAN